MWDKRSFSPGRSRLGTLAGALTLTGGIGLLIKPYWLYGWLVILLPWEALLLTVCCIYGAVVSPARSKARRRDIILAVIAAGACGILFLRPDWRDMILWYLFDLWLVFTAAAVLRPALRPGVERQQLWRWSGSLIALGFAALMLFKPSSGLSEALTLLGGFAAAWGTYMLAIPPVRE